jgi:hypothetical protein
MVLWREIASVVLAADAGQTYPRVLHDFKGTKSTTENTVREFPILIVVENLKLILRLRANRVVQKQTELVEASRRST